MISRGKSENLIYLFIWIIVLALPVFTLRGEANFNWTRVVTEWIRIFPFLLIFVLNNRLLVPALLFQKKHLQYLAFLTLAVVLISFLFDYTKVFLDYFMMNDPVPFRSPAPFDQPPGFDRMPPPREELEHLAFWGRSIDRIVFSYLVAGFNTAVKLVFRSQEEEKKIEEQKKIHLQTELSFLRQQISPHFFMNTLNNIHALIDIDTNQAQVAVIKLSKLMRYLLTESQQGKAPIKDEFDFLNSYIDLMRLRYSDRVKISVELNVEKPEKKIPSLLFVSLVENAFKYGVSYSKPSFITIWSKTTNEELIFSVKNSISPEKSLEPGTGVGLENLRKQLSLIYGSNFKFEVQEIEEVYQVLLQIPLEK